MRAVLALCSACFGDGTGGTPTEAPTADGDDGRSMIDDGLWRMLIDDDDEIHRQRYFGRFSV